MKRNKYFRQKPTFYGDPYIVVKLSKCKNSLHSSKTISQTLVQKTHYARNIKKIYIGLIFLKLIVFWLNHDWSQWLITLELTINTIFCVPRTQPWWWKKSQDKQLHMHSYSVDTAYRLVASSAWNHNNRHNRIHDIYWRVKRKQERKKPVSLLGMSH